MYNKTELFFLAIIDISRKLVGHARKNSPDVGKVQNDLFVIQN